MKNFTKRILPVLMAMVMILCSSSVAFATEIFNFDVMPTSYGDVMPLSGGEETWTYTRYAARPVGSFSMVGSNMTKTKTIDSDERCECLTISATYSCSSSSKLKVEIVDASTGKVYAYGVSKAGKSSTVSVETPKNATMAGKKVKIRFIIQDTNGNYSPNRSCTVSYSYALRLSPTE